VSVPVKELPDGYSSPGITILASKGDSSMAKVLKCSDVTPGCDFEIRGTSEDEVLKKADEHAKTAHNMQEMPLDVLSKVRNAIHDEADTATMKVSA
jgi:predicted small metal-binding protein